MPESERVRSPGTKVSLTAQVNTYNCNQLCHFANFRIRTMLCLAQNHNSQVNCTLRHPANILELGALPYGTKLCTCTSGQHAVSAHRRQPMTLAQLFTSTPKRLCQVKLEGMLAFTTILCQCTGSFHMSPISKHCKTESKNNKIH